MNNVFRPALLVLVVLSVLTGLAYPLLVFGIARLTFPHEAAGSLMRKNGLVIGSELIGQPFEGERWFAGRPSATSRMPCDAAASSGSNLGPLNPALAAALAQRVHTLRESGVAGVIPVDLVTTSASGLDPHISPASANLQVDRVARARGLAPERVRQLVARHVEEPAFGFLGEARVNVLELNLDLDSLR